VTGSVDQLRASLRDDRDPISAIQVARARFVLERTFGLSRHEMVGALVGLGMIDWLADGVAESMPERLPERSAMHARALGRLAQRIVAAVLDDYDREDDDARLPQGSQGGGSAPTGAGEGGGGAAGAADGGAPVPGR
jgi:hypothetical protein